MKDSRSKIILRIFGIVVLVLILSEIFRPQPLNWKYSFTSNDKIPYGTYVLFHELPDLIGSSVEKTTSDPFLFLSKNRESTATYIFINDELYFDDRQSGALLDFVSEGGTAFISAKTVSGIIADSIGFKTDFVKNILNSKLELGFYDAQLNSGKETDFENHFLSHFVEIDSLNTQMLGYYAQKSEERHPNFIASNYGKGKVFIHLEPIAFTNYFLLDQDQQYAASALSYLDENPIFWDEYLKTGRVIINSPMRYVLNHDSLRWSYYTLLGALLIFILFRAKREQQIIPVITPRNNASVAFTKVIGSLYFQHGDYSNIIAKQITFFLERVRAKFLLDTQDLSPEFAEKLAVKSGNNIETTKALIELMITLRNMPVHSEEHLLELNKKLENFKL